MENNSPNAHRDLNTIILFRLPLFIRLSATDWTEGDRDLNDTIELSKILHEKGVDLIDCSSGGNIISAKIQVAPGYQVHFSEEIRKTGILT